MDLLLRLILQVLWVLIILGILTALGGLLDVERRHENDLEIPRQTQTS